MFKSVKSIICGAVLIVAITLTTRLFVRGDRPEGRMVLYHKVFVIQDGESQSVLPSTIKWDIEKISPFEKGGGPAVVFDNGRGLIVLSIVGLPLEGGLDVEVGSSGYRSEFVNVEAVKGGVSFIGDRGLEVVSLLREK